MRTLLVSLSMCMFFLHALPAMAYPKGGDRGIDRGIDRGVQRDYPHARLERFNVFCRYKRIDGDGRYHRCYAAALFEKWVTWRGAEIEDDSEHPFNPLLEVDCDGDLIHNDPSYRYTDEQGTRLQAQTGPYPAVLLPPRALRPGRRNVASYLELRDQLLRGSCYVYTGNP